MSQGVPGPNSPNFRRGHLVLALLALAFVALLPRVSQAQDLTARIVKIERHYAAQEYRKVIREGTGALRAAERQPGPNPAAIGYVSSLLSTAYLHLGEFGPAERYALRAVAIMRRIEGDSPLVARLSVTAAAILSKAGTSGKSPLNCPREVVLPSVKL